MKQRKRILLLGLFLALVTGVTFAVLKFRGQEQEIRKKAGAEPHLYLEQSDMTTQAYAVFYLKVNTAGQESNGVDAVIKYDPDVLTFTQAQRVNFFSEFEYSSKSGEVRIYNFPESPLVTKSGIYDVAKLEFYIEKQEPTDLEIVCDLGQLTGNSSAVWQGKEAVNIIDCSSLKGFTYTPSGVPTGELSPTTTGEPTISLTPSPTGEPTVTPSPTEIPDVTSTPSPTPEPDKAEINFKVSLQGVDDSSEVVSNPLTEVVIKAGFSTVVEFSGVELIPDEGKKFRGKVSLDEWDDTYSIYVKGNRHLSRKFCADGQTKKCSGQGNINLVEGVNEFDFSGRPLQPGDIVQSGDQADLINDGDFQFLQSELGRNGISLADLDYNGLVNGRDVVLFLQTLETKYGDNI